MAATALDVIRRAMFLLRVLQPGQPVQARYSGPMLDILNDLIDGANTERLTCYGDIVASINFTANKNQYTVGVGGDFNVQRPDQLRMAWVRDPTSNPPQDYPPQRRLSAEEWYRIPQKALNAGAPSTYPTEVYYDPSDAALGKLNVWPMPTVSTYQQFLLLRGYLASFAALTTAFGFPPGYMEWIKKALAIESAGLFGKTPDAYLTDVSNPRSAAAAKAKLQAINLVEAATPLAQDSPQHRVRGTHAWNILTGGPNPN